MGTERIKRHSPVRLLARLGYFLNRIHRPLFAKNVFSVRVWKIINLFWLPGPEVLKKRFEAFRGPGNLFRKNRGITCQIEGLGSEYPGSLMVPMILTYKSPGKKCEYHFRSR